MNAACGSDSNDSQKQGGDAAPDQIESGLPGTPPIGVEVLASGSGERPKIGQVVSVHYTGTFQDGRKFDSSRDRGQPLSFPVGTGKVIKGWDMALLRMRVGDHWKVTIPHQLAYGEEGYPGAIPPRSTLVFDMELMSIE